MLQELPGGRLFTPISQMRKLGLRAGDEKAQMSKEGSLPERAAASKWQSPLGAWV